MENSKLEKQIENMAEDILQEYTNCYSEVDRECLEKMLRKLASDVAEEIFAEIEKMLLDNHIGHYKTTIDTWCYNFNNEIISEIAELKKKYIGKDTNVGCKTEEGK